MTSIRDQLQKHMQDEDSTLNDCVVDALYREACGVPADEDTDLEQVELWATQMLAD